MGMCTLLDPEMIGGDEIESTMEPWEHPRLESYQVKGFAKSLGMKVRSVEQSN